MMEWVATISLSIFLLYEAIVDIKMKSLRLGIFPVAAAVGLVCGIIKGLSWYDFVLSIIPGLILILISILTREAIGLGDGLGVIVIGLYCGIVDCFVLCCIAFLFSAIFSVLLVIIKHRKREFRIPFYPFLLIAWGIVGFAF